MLVLLVKVSDEVAEVQKRGKGRWITMGSLTEVLMEEKGKRGREGGRSRNSNNKQAGF